jgi:hypothetical protein
VIESDGSRITVGGQSGLPTFTKALYGEQLPVGRLAAQAIDETERIRIENKLLALRQVRESSFYFELDFAQSAADLALRQARGVDRLHLDGSDTGPNTHAVATWRRTESRTDAHASSDLHARAYPDISTGRTYTYCGACALAV